MAYGVAADGYWLVSEANHSNPNLNKTLSASYVLRADSITNTSYKDFNSISIKSHKQFLMEGSKILIYGVQK